MTGREGWHGWDAYAAFYDWENARTLGRRDVGFWRQLVRREAAPVLELGCGTGRLLMPMARTGVPVTGLDRSAPMLARAAARAKRLPRSQRPCIVRGDIRVLPFRDATFGVVMAPYGLLQSLVRPADLTQMLAESARVLRRDGLLGVDLVPDLPTWQEYRGLVSLKGRSERGGQITLVESVRQDRRRGLTIFDEEFTERRGRTVERRTFSLTFRTVALPAVVTELEAAGFRVDALLGDYRGAAWHDAADVWVIVARKS
jgi:ubiquinone/menaquinone biosynthesis C-methylase UbiE